MQSGLRQKKMNVGDASGVRVFNRNHCKIDLSVLDGIHCLFKSQTGNVFLAGVDGFSGNMGIGAGYTLISYAQFHRYLKL